LPSFTRAIEPFPVDADTPSRRFELRADLEPAEAPAYFINDQRWPLNNPVHVQLGALEIWEIANLGDHPHPFHIHGMFAQVLGDDGRPTQPLAWKDTVQVEPRGLTRIALRYDTPGMWMYHCTIPEHAERGMMGDVHVMEDEGG